MKALKKDSQIYIDNIFTAIENCYTGTAKPDNASLTALYNEIGKQICLQGEKSFVAHLAELLKNECPNIKGFSPRNIRRMREFYLRYENNPKLVQIALTLNWTQNSVILEMCKTSQETEFYLKLTSNKKLSKLALVSAIESKDNEQEPAGINDEHCDSTVSPVCDFTGTTAIDTHNEKKTDVTEVVEPLHQGTSRPKPIHKNKGDVMNNQASPQPSEDMVKELFGKIRSERVKYDLKESFKTANPKMANKICYGYNRLENGELTVNKSEAESVKFIFTLYIKGNSLGKIVKALKEQGILSPTGKCKWNKETLFKLISNEKYVGTVLLGKTYTQNGKQIKNNEQSEKVKIANHHTPIITIEQFETAQVLKEERSKQLHQPPPQHSLTFGM